MYKPRVALEKTERWHLLAVPVSAKVRYRCGYRLATKKSSSLNGMLCTGTHTSVKKAQNAFFEKEPQKRTERYIHILPILHALQGTQKCSKHRSIFSLRIYIIVFK